jgi:hypothetical protein
MTYVTGHCVRHSPISPHFSCAAGAPLDVGEWPQRDIKRAAYAYEQTREAAMAAFARSWRRDSA